MVDIAPPAEKVLKVAIYNADVAQKTFRTSSTNFHKQVRGDIEEAFSECHADIVCLCELAEDEEALEDQEALLDELVHVLQVLKEELQTSRFVLVAEATCLFL